MEDPLDKRPAGTSGTCGHMSVGEGESSQASGGKRASAVEAHPSEPEAHGAYEEEDNIMGRERFAGKQFSRTEHDGRCYGAHA